MKAKNITCVVAANPWRSLAAAVVLRAVEDVQGKNTLAKRPQREKVSKVAAQWLQAGAGGLLDELDIDAHALLDALEM